MLDKLTSKALEDFEKKLTKEQKQNLSDVHNLHEKMVVEGLVTKPQYDLAPVGPLSYRKALNL